MKLFLDFLFPVPYNAEINGNFRVNSYRHEELTPQKITTCCCAFLMHQTASQGSEDQFRQLKFLSDESSTPVGADFQN
jgi:hypothetical protein